MLAPHGLWLLAQDWINNRNVVPIPWTVLQRNALLRNRHLGQRCFILGNAPSVKGMNLNLLAGQTLISVSSGYRHRDFDLLRPTYHCVPQIPSGAMTEGDVVEWFEEMHTQLGGAHLFLNETEAELVRQYGLFKGRQVSYVCLRENADEIRSRTIPDLAGPVPRVESVPIMALMIAMHLGFKDIGILGVDHDSWRSGEYHYAFERRSSTDFSVTTDGKILTPHFDTFASLGRLWRQYRWLREVAENNGIRIFNCGVGGELDEFPRIPLEAALADGGRHA
jgi:hypothetical protein